MTTLASHKLPRITILWAILSVFLTHCTAVQTTQQATPTIAILPPPVIAGEAIGLLPTPKIEILNEDGSAIPVSVTEQLIQSSDSLPLPPVTIIETAVPKADAAVDEDEQTVAVSGSVAVKTADSAIPTMTATIEPSPTITNTPEPTSTPIPTFTPPALAGTSPNEHYWFFRPIAEGGTNWTDKVYPYGSTRGGELRPHHGVEFNVPSGTDVWAVASGTVVHAGDDKTQLFGPQHNFYGNLVVIQHDTKYNGQSVYTLYAHLSVPLVATGQRVGARELIAQSGGTGVADGAHLHFEVRVGANNYNATRNPRLWIYPFDGFGTVAGKIKWPNNQNVEAAPITLNRLDAKSRYYGTTSYEGTTVKSDDRWGENFAIDDVVAGYYVLTVDTGTEKYREEFYVHPYNTSFVEITIDR